MTSSLLDHPIQKILIIQWSAMGDCVIATAIFDDLRNFFPEAQIHLNTLPPWDQLFTHDTRLDKVIAFPMRRQGLKSIFRWLKYFNREKYDLVIDLQSNDRTKILLSLAKLLGMKKGTFISRRPFFCYDATSVQSKQPIHILTQLKSVLETIQVPLLATSPKLIPAPENKKRVQQQMDATVQDQKFAIFIPGCSPKAQEKRWPEHHYIELAQLLLTESFQQIVLIGAKDEEDICNTIARSDNRIINLCNQTKLLDLPIWCEKAALIVGNDTGTSHIAATTKTPQITLFGPTIPAQSKPFGENIMIISAKDFPNIKSSAVHPMEGISAKEVFSCYLKSRKNH